MKSKRILMFYSFFMVLAIFSGAAFGSEDNSRAGTRVFDFLKIQIGSRATAMGGAFTGVANDESSLYYNPAGIAALDGKRFWAGYHNNIFEMQSGFLGYIHPIAEGRKMAVFVNYLNYGDFVRTDVNGIEDGKFSGSDMLFGGAYAMEVAPQLSLGGAVKFIYEKIDNYSATGFAIDFGGKYSLRDERTSLGLMIQNLGAQLSAFTDEGEKYPLPLYIRGGASSYLKGLPLLVAGDLIFPTDNDIYFSLGAELLNLKPLYVRLGWTNFGLNYKTGSSKDNLAGLSAGFGVEYRRMQISYAISPQSELGTSHRITLSGGF